MLLFFQVAQFYLCTFPRSKLRKTQESQLSVVKFSKADSAIFIAPHTCAKQYLAVIPRLFCDA